MNALPRITIKPEKGGWSAVCAAGKWERFEHARPLLDKAAREHQGKCRPGGRKARG